MDSGKEKNLESFWTSCPLSSLNDSNNIYLESKLYSNFLSPVDKYTCLKGLNDFEKRTDVTDNFHAFKGFLRFLLYLNSNHSDKFNNIQEPKREFLADFWDYYCSFQNTINCPERIEKLPDYSIYTEKPHCNENTNIEKNGSTFFNESRKKNFMQL